jgi:hypothetical protein
MCGVVVGLGWGKGYGLGTRYITQAPEFKESKQHRWVGGRVGGWCRPWHYLWHAAPGTLCVTLPLAAAPCHAPQAASAKEPPALLPPAAAGVMPQLRGVLWRAV